MLEGFLGGFVGQLFGEGSIEAARGTPVAFTLGEWARLTIGCILCLLTCDGIAAAFGLPAEPGFNGSLLMAPGPVGSMLVVFVAVVAALVVGTLVAGRIGVEAAVLCAGVGLAAVAVRCGPITPVLQYAAGRSVFVALAFESILLVGAMGGGWWLLERLAMAARAASGDPAQRLGFPTEVTDATTGQKFAVLGVGVLVAGICELVLVVLPAGKQAMCGVAVASAVGAWAAYQYLPLGEGIWYWTAPSAAGVIGYLLAFVSGDGGPIGELHGWAGALARPTPLDYASLGTAAALLGHWSSRRWAQTEEPPTLADPESPPA
jgi:hypothetical protein